MNAVTPADFDFHGLFDASPNPYLVLDRRLYIVGANKAYLTSVKRALADIVGRWAWDAFPSDKEKVDQAISSFERVIRTKQPDTMPLLRFDVPRPEAEGGGFMERYWSITHTPVLNTDGEVELVLQHPIDVTELQQLRAETQLRPAQAGIFARAQTVYESNLALKAESDRLSDLFAQAPIFMTVLRGPDHRFEFANDAYFRVIGHRRQVIGMTVAEVLPDAAEQGYVKLLDEVFQNGEAFSVNSAEYTVQAVPGGPVDKRYVDFVYQPIRDAHGAVSGIFVAGSDVTKAHSITAELREREQRLRLIVEAARDYAILTLDPERRVTTWTAGTAAIFGYVAEEIVGQSADILFTPEDRAAGQPEKEIEGARTMGGAPDVRWHQRKDGSRVFLNGVMRPLRDADGVEIGFLKIARDETDRLAAEQALRDLNATLEQRVEERSRDLVTAEEALRQSQKMEAVGQLTGGLAHDFNNLLAVITGSLELLQMRIAKGRLSDIDRFIAASQAAAKRATSLTHRLLAFSRRQTLDPQETDSGKLVGGMADMIRRTVGPEITVEIASMDDLWTTLVDPNQLENALLNLAINARDAMPEGGRIMIEAANRSFDERSAETRDMAPGEYVAVSVSDTGSGMPPEVVARAFEPFYTTKPLGQGTGLGLSMIYGFVRQSEGQVRIHSEVGKGTTVNLYLPRSQGQVHDIADRVTETLTRAEQGQTVLVVDDEQSIRMLVVDVLEELGYTAVEANDGLAGLRVLQSDLRVDLLVTDVGMPGMNGRQLADAGRVLRPCLKVLFITGYAETAVVSHGHLEEGMAIVTKPFGLDALTNRIQGLIQGGQVSRS